jgi:hypothetical protein
MNHGLPPEDWDTQLQQLGGSILQSRPWGRFQQVLGRELYWAEGDGWRWLASLRVSRGLRYLLANYGPAGEGSALPVAIDSLLAAGREAGVDFVRIEPQVDLSVVQLRRLGGVNIAELDPEHTRIVDLTKEEATLRTELGSSHRNRVNGTERRGIHIRQTADPADFDQFLQMLHDTAAHSRVIFWPDTFFRQLHDSLGPEIVHMYIAEVEGQPVASAMFYDWGNTRYYAHAGAYQERNRKIKASVSLVWQALIDAKAAGLQRYDLWGVAPEGDSAHRLAGISEFKAGFGGQQVTYCGTWDIPLKPSKYRLYGVYRKLRGRQ